VDALRAAGPDKACWTWWPRSPSPRTAGAAARHQVQELAVHTYDAQLALGAPRPLPDAVALDGVDEFLATCVATDLPWPHDPVTVEYHATEGDSWRLRLSSAGASVGRAEGPGEADAALWGTASDLVLLFYGRLPLDAFKIEGDRWPFEGLIEWEPGS
ncbi:maleylpyruvate isomerase N-terminal domain-containing protein, partial [Actinoplanes sp. NPDC049596]